MNYKINTPDGFVDFLGITKTYKQPVMKITTTLGYVKCAKHHRFFLDNGSDIVVEELKIGDILKSKEGNAIVLDITEQEPEELYEIIGVQSSNSSYYIKTNNGYIESHNCDELDFVKPSIAEEFWTSVLPTLSTGGGCIVTSTPRHEDKTFATIWKQANHQYDNFGNKLEGGCGINGFFPLFYTWAAHPLRDEEWKRGMLIKLGPQKFRQEMECEFISDEETLIDAIFLENMQPSKPIAYTGNVRWFSKPRANTVHIVTLDPSVGTGGDYAAIQVFEVDSMTQVAEWQHNKTPIKGQIAILKQILEQLYYHQYNDPEQENEPEIYWTVENNGVGEGALVIIEETGEDRFYGTFVSEKRTGSSSRRKGLNTTHPTKLSACIRFKSLLETGRLHIKSEQLIRQLKRFQGNGTSYSAKSGDHDDLVMATILVVRVFQLKMNWLSNIESLTEIIETDDELPAMTTLFD